MIASGITILVLRLVGYRGTAFKKIWGVEGVRCEI